MILFEPEFCGAEFGVRSRGQRLLTPTLLRKESVFNTSDFDKL
ncbi:Zn-ribbon-containing, possibly RNA-binding protein and truncated derivatives [Crocosphaera watsonii WH 0402]|uniref:Zn-ribbon-containing, possibly RNA-binding protein and truncated derivatives n=2 Tax=Crocosphaera watsonii TaxID=263511 RepID=T2JNW4_CROWT|nr:hypothetical protein CWATWH0005_3136 [Crocosphaera watsonii WH 0005]CCQ66731.1 Zn-ribbon-containing, possibly RNA-binding protein and truncated derivatives [Crocosphaera watsonii WH 0402]